MILVGRGTFEADRPQPRRAPAGPRASQPAPGAADARRRRSRAGPRLASPEAIHDLHDVNDLLVEGGSGAASAFLTADLVDRLLIYRAPILIGEGTSSVGYIGLTDLAAAHGRWRFAESRGAWHGPARSLRAHPL